jgi:hypothetical protein
MTRPRVIIVNPIGLGLLHYTHSLTSVLETAGATVAVLAINEPSASQHGRLMWLAGYFRALIATRRARQRANVIITWPVLGYWDFAIVRVLLGKMGAHLVVHDPNPLVKARGYGWIARRVASLGSVRASPLVHSESAANIVIAQTVGLQIVCLPHPMFAPKQPVPRGGHTIVRVLGQYKHDRDTASLRKLASTSHRNWTFQIVGRGWSAIPGWDVIDRYVSEEEFDSLIRSSTVVLIPYRRFFQSGVAIRSLELGTPVVGPRASSLADLLGADCAWLVGDEPWDRAVAAAASADPAAAHRVATRAYHDMLARWQTWLASPPQS